MAEISKTQVTTATAVFRVEVRILSPTAIDPIAFVSEEQTQQEILARAGLSSSLLFISARTIKSGGVGDNRFWDVEVSFDSTPISATGHQHDSSTLSHPLQESYVDGSTINVTSEAGPLVLVGEGATEILTVKDSSGNLLRVPADGNLQVGRHVKWEGDSQYDIGTSDGGGSLRRPRDIYVGREVKAEKLDANLAETNRYAFKKQLTNPDLTGESRHLYWRTNDNKLHVWNGTEDTTVGAGGSPSFNSVNALRFNKEGVAEGRVTTLGYSSRGDGGGTTFYHDTTDTTSADNGTSILVDLTGARWKLLFQGRVSVLQFGAVGDGITPDDPAIQAAVDYLESQNGGTLFFPAGTYLVNSEDHTAAGSGTRYGVWIKGSDIHLMGVGRKSIISTDTTLRPDGEPPRTMLYVSNAAEDNIDPPMHVHFSHLYFQGSVTDPAAECLIPSNPLLDSTKHKGFGLYVLAHYIEVSSCYFFGMGTGVHGSGGYHDLWVHDSEFSYFTAGGTFAAHRSYIINNVFIGWGTTCQVGTVGHGVDVRDQAHNLIVQGNYFFDVTGSCVHSFGSSEVDRITVSGNVFEDVFVGVQLGQRGGSTVAVTGNVFDWSNYPSRHGNGVTTGVKVNSIYNCHVSGNTFYGGIPETFVSGAEPNSRGVDIQPNGLTVIVPAIVGLTVSNNTFYRMKRAIRICAVEDINIFALNYNHIYDTSYGIQFAIGCQGCVGTLKNGSVQYNYFQPGPARYPGKPGGAPYATIEDECLGPPKNIPDGDAGFLTTHNIIVDNNTRAAYLA